MPKNTFKVFNNFIEHLEPKCMTLVPFFKLFLGPKTHILMPPKSCDHYALTIRTSIT